jgi:hypothetical protein
VFISVRRVLRPKLVGEKKEEDNDGMMVQKIRKGERRGEKGGGERKRCVLPCKKKSRAKRKYWGAKMISFARCRALL